MKKKVVITLAVLAIIAAIGWNIKQSMDLQSTNEMSALTIANIEALTWSEWNSWEQWLDQGFHPDEREYPRDCPSNTSSSVTVGISYGGVGYTVGGSYTQTNPSGRQEITCVSGDTNCSQVGCYWKKQYAVFGNLPQQQNL
jgi:hypothetical protein